MKKTLFVLVNQKLNRYESTPWNSLMWAHGRKKLIKAFKDSNHENLHTTVVGNTLFVINREPLHIVEVDSSIVNFCVENDMVNWPKPI